MKGLMVVDTVGLSVQVLSAVMVSGLGIATLRQNQTLGRLDHNVNSPEGVLAQVDHNVNSRSEAQDRKIAAMGDEIHALRTFIEAHPTAIDAPAPDQPPPPIQHPEVP